MRVSRQSPPTGEWHDMDLDITQEQLDEFLSPGRSRLAQEIFPNLTDGEREFIMTGYTQADWDAMFSGDEDEEDESC